jgi:hypothetical protein
MDGMRVTCMLLHQSGPRGGCGGLRVAGQEPAAALSAASLRSCKNAGGPCAWSHEGVPHLSCALLRRCSGRGA